MNIIQKIKYRIKGTLNRSIRLSESNNSDFKKLIEGSTVSLVGPAIYLDGLRLGDEIDNHDVVVRVNRGHELIKDHSLDIGSKTDILYSCLIEKPENAGEIDINVLKNNFKIKFLCASPHSAINGIANRTDIHPLANRKKFKQLQSIIPSRIVDHLFWNEIASNIATRPNTGYIAIFDLLRFKPKRIKVYGYSFYFTDTLKGYKDGMTIYKSSEELCQHVFKSKRHKQYNMWDYARKTLLNNPVVELDPILLKILSMDKFDIKNYRNLNSFHLNEVK